MIKAFIVLVIITITIFLLNNQSEFFYSKIYPKNKSFYYTLITILLIILIISITLDLVNTTIIIVHYFIFLLIFKFISLLIKKITRKEYSKTILSTISLIVTILYLTYGIYSVYHVTQTNYSINTNKKIDDLRIVQISDSHIGSTFNGDEIAKYTTEINNLNPDIVVITGDFVDDDTKKIDMIKSIQNIAKIKTKYGIYFVFGNHDRAYFNYRDFSTFDLKMELKQNNIIILEDTISLINENIVLIGRQDKSVKLRKEMTDLVKFIDNDKYVIVLDHQPNDYKKEALSNVDLVLSGHTHGGQLIPLGPLSVLANFNDSYYGKKVIGNTNFIVNSGISDWRLKYKTGSTSEYVVIDIKGDSR